MNADLLYGYLLDMGWFFLITLAVMVSAAALIVFVDGAQSLTSDREPRSL